MAGKYKEAITINEAINAIDDGDYLLPAIQRKFVWSSHQICVLFDSIMRGYPINSFMMWEVTDSKIKNGYKFYEFLKNYCQRFEVENPLKPTSASSKNFKAVIDGQQRLTSLYIGLCGTYAYKQPRTWWPNTKDDEKLPPRKLYVDLKAPVSSEDDESLMKYNFKFLTDKQYKDSLASSDGKHHWYCLHEIRKAGHIDGASNVYRHFVMPYLTGNKLAENEFASDTLSQLYSVINHDALIHYFNEQNQEPDHVLDVFIRTNSGGTKLDYSDLLMSIAVASWSGDFRKEIEDLIKSINQDNTMGFYVGGDWILKTCLMLMDSDVKFKVKNFNASQVSVIQASWSEICECIKASFKLVKLFGLNAQSLTSKNAVIPIAYYLYTKKSDDGNPLYKSINNLSKHHAQRGAISQWLYMVLLKGTFGNQADSILISMRNVLKKYIDGQVFPLEKIVDHFKATNKDLRFDEDYTESLLNTQHGESRCRPLLHLLFPEMNVTQVFHIDHLHPQSAFFSKKLKDHTFLRESEDLLKFYSNANHWNSIANLHLLNDSQNMSKNDSSLETWLSNKDVHLKKGDLLIEESVSLALSSFKEFYEQRRAALKNRLKSRVYLASSLVTEPLIDDSDEEVVEEVTV